MNQIKHFFRYEIPGYLSFIYVFIIVVSTLKKSVIVAYIIPNLHSILFAGFLIAIPIGWIIYQIYDQYRSNGFHCHPNTLVKVKSWCSDENLDKYLKKEFLKFISNKKDNKKAVMKDKLKKIYYQQAIDIGIYSSSKDFQDHFELLINNLSNKYNSYDSRYIIGIIGYVPQISMIAIIIFFNSSMLLKYNFIEYNINRLILISFFTLFVTAFSVIISAHKKNIYYRIQAQEDYLISIKKKKIINAIDTLLNVDNKKV